MPWGIFSRRSHSGAPKTESHTHRRDSGPMSNFIGHVKKNCLRQPGRNCSDLGVGFRAGFICSGFLCGENNPPAGGGFNSVIAGQQAQFSVRSLRIVVQKTQHFKAITLGEFTFDPDMIASPESSETIPIGVPHIL
jgi:hypothetical protein